jgi:hypothetical protein
LIAEALGRRSTAPEAFRSLPDLAGSGTSEVPESPPRVGGHTIREPLCAAQAPGQSPLDEPPNEAYTEVNGSAEETPGAADPTRPIREDGRADRARPEVSSDRAGQSQEGEEAPPQGEEDSLEFTPRPETWRGRPAGLVSFWEIMDKYGHFIARYVPAIRLLARALKSPTDRPLDGAEIALIKRQVNAEVLSGWFVVMEMPLSIDYLTQFDQRLGGRNLDLNDAVAMLTQLADRIVSELKDRNFIYVRMADVARYKKVLDGWGPNVKECFPLAVYDIAESSRCLALGRYSAAVFHAMRVLEVGISALAVRLGVSHKKRDRSWSTVLDAIQTQVDSKFPKGAAMTPPRRAKRREYNQMIGQFHVFERAWRDYTVHNPVEYKRGSATEIVDAVAVFFRTIQTNGLKQRRVNRRP